MKVKKKELEDALDELNDLEKLFDDRIVENNTTGKNGGMMVEQFNHCFMYYREKVWKAKKIIGGILRAKNSV
jgi:molybdenum-dependent DNA-binding transcriptional regulator ModE